MSTRSRLRNFAKGLSSDDRLVKNTYKESLNKTIITKDDSTEIAIIIHLYYTDSWPLFKKSLENLNGVKFDLFVTIPTSSISFQNTILKTFKNAYVFEVPNRGRDVLPFLAVGRAVEEAGYQYLLKIHSKKSLHRTDGSEWLEGMTSALLPADKTILKKLISTLSEDETGIIGPDAQYLPLSINFDANGVHMTNILTRLYGKATANSTLQENRSEYGFFAGTMFWARMDAIRPLFLANFQSMDFEKEGGQIDGTFAHAVERVLSLMPEIEKKKMYEISKAGLKQITYRSDNIPDWSDVYIGPKN